MNEELTEKQDSHEDQEEIIDEERATALPSPPLPKKYSGSD
jgi:hypothetical protein